MTQTRPAQRSIEKTRRGQRQPLPGAGALLALGLLAAAQPGCLDSRGGKTDDDDRDAASPGTGPDGGGLNDLALTDDQGSSRDGSPPPVDLGMDASSTNDDPFDVTSCMGVPMTSVEALARIGSMPRIKLGDATLMRRSRTCSGTTPATCGAWGTPVVHTQSLLTYSGGVTTDYKTFAFPTHLIVFAQSGQPKAVIRHESDYRHDASANTRGAVFSFGMTPMETPYPKINVWDFAPAPYRYEDLLAQLGNKGLLVVTGTCARFVVENGLTTEIAGLYRF